MIDKNEIKNMAIMGKKLSEWINTDPIAKDIKNIITAPDELNREYYAGYFRCLDDIKTAMKEQLPKNKENSDFNNLLDRVFKI
jgi:hypothetical protein